MIKILSTLFALNLIGISASAAQLDISCTQNPGAAASLIFSLDTIAHSITFQNIAAFQGGEILAQTNYIYDPSAGQDTVSFKYDWYYVARYQLVFDRFIPQLNAGDETHILFSGDDDDGVRFDNQKLLCTVQ